LSEEIGGPDLRQRPVRFRDWKHYRHFWGHFLVCEAQAQIQQMVNEFIVKPEKRGGGLGGNNAGNWHKAQARRTSNSGGLQL
ncbi:unnamed protein product, partial [Amoebophrya sp. A25]